MNLLGVLEWILFVVGDEGITLKQICEILNIENEAAKELLLELKSSAFTISMTKLLNFFLTILVRFYYKYLFYKFSHTNN